MFYVKKRKDSEVQGPFTIQEVNQMVKQKKFRFNSLFVYDTAQDLEKVRNLPKDRWYKLADAEGFEPDPDSEREFLSWTALVVVIVAVVVVLGLVKLADILHRIQ